MSQKHGSRIDRSVSFWRPHAVIPLAQAGGDGAGCVMKRELREKKNRDFLLFIHWRVFLFIIVTLVSRSVYPWVGLGGVQSSISD